MRPTLRPSLQRQIDRLYALPRRDFVRARNSLAAALRGEGRSDEAAAVRRLAKPDVAAWAINRVARDHPHLVGGFIDAVHRLGRAQLGEGPNAAEARDNEAAARRELLKEAAAALARDGTRATPALLRRVADTLLAAVADEEMRCRLEAGRLTDELPAPGFAAALGIGRRRRSRRPAAH